MCVWCVQQTCKEQLDDPDKRTLRVHESYSAPFAAVKVKLTIELLLVLAVKVIPIKSLWLSYFCVLFMCKYNDIACICSLY